VPRLEKPASLWLRLGALRVQRANETTKPDELWQGDAYDPDAPRAQDVPIYFRMADRFTVAAELASAVIARALGLPTPQPYLVHIPAGTLPASRFAPRDGTPGVTVATHDVGGGTFAQLLREDSEYARRLLAQWQHLIPTVAFDEWLANLDRNFGNILFVAQNLWLIDHADTFGGSTRKLFPLRELTDEAFENKLALLLSQGTSTQRQKALEDAREWLTFTAGALDVSTLASETDMKRWHTSEEQDELLDFVRTRLRITHRLLCQRLGYPQLPLP
jgi:hypothetical protein